MLHTCLLLTIYLVSVENFILQRTQTGLQTNIKPTYTVTTAKNKKHFHTCWSTDFISIWWSAVRRLNKAFSLSMTQMSTTHRMTMSRCYVVHIIQSILFKKHSKLVLYHTYIQIYICAEKMYRITKKVIMVTSRTVWLLNFCS